MESTIYCNHKIIINEEGKAIAFEKNGVVMFNLHDDVKVTGDTFGYICPGITKPGIGKIVEIRGDMSDRYFGVQMENGEFGYMKYTRMTRLQ